MYIYAKSYMIIFIFGVIFSPFFFINEVIMYNSLLIFLYKFTLKSNRFVLLSSFVCLIIALMC